MIRPETRPASEFQLTWSPTLKRAVMFASSPRSRRSPSSQDHPDLHYNTVSYHAKQSVARARQPAGATTVRSESTIASRVADSETPARSVSRSAARRDWANASVYTVGHSTRTQAELTALLRHYGVATLVDVRAIPRSHHNPQFNLEELARALPEAGIAYAHLPRLGGLRRGIGAASANDGWRNASFRAYADYMQTADFAHGLEEVRSLTHAGPVAIMCADALTIRGVEVREIRSLTRTEAHKLTPFARVDGLRITYPAVDAAATEEQRSIG